LEPDRYRPIKDLRVSDHYHSEHSGVEHIYLNQTYSGIPVYNAIAGIHITHNGQVAFATNTFIGNLTAKVNTPDPVFSALEAIQKAALHLGLVPEDKIRLKAKKPLIFLFEGGDLSNSDIPVKQKYHPVNNGTEVKLIWQLMIDDKHSADMWNIHVDAHTGAIIAQYNLTVYCNFPENGAQSFLANNCNESVGSSKTNNQALNILGETYNVFPLPVESPIHGERALLTSPADPTASPFGWHDIDGDGIADYTITRGNNAHAYLDVEENDSSLGDEPDGGDDLNFDFPFDPVLDPEENQAAAITQLFYGVNFAHDFAYHYGFDEAAGNFQTENHSGEGFGNDQVNAEGQDGNDYNNANFSTPADGAPGRMQMYLWNSPGGQLLNVAEPESIAGLYNTGHAIYGPPVSTDAITGELAEAFDGSNNPGLGCETIINPEEINGKIALIDRGDCVFERKTLNAEAAGAIAVIICNYQQGTTTMGGSFGNEEPTIPTIMVEQSTCQIFRQMIDEGITVSIGIQDDGFPSTLDACFDNGVIIHEYTHGISNRLTGGPAQETCLFNDEQMGEGWSDFFALASTVKAGDTGTTPRGVGNYINKSGVNGSGLRRLPYSTDMSINDQDYDDIIGTEIPHPVGEVWTDILWDLYWEMIDIYDFDEDLFSGTGGNNMAIQLVMDGMKLQACNPGFIDGRNAILAADSILYDGAHACLIWEIFARRGVGYDADQGSVYSRNDGFPGFNTLPECIKELKLEKQVTPLIVSGETIQVNLKVTNHKEGIASAVRVDDEIPQGTAYINGSATGFTPEVNGNLITFDIGDMQPGSSANISYQLSTAATEYSESQFLDGMEAGDNLWGFNNLTGNAIWGISDEDPNTGLYSWFVPNTEERNDQTLYFFDPFLVHGEQPVLRFAHKYDTEPGKDGGLVDISIDGGDSWEDVAHLFFRNEYRGEIAFLTFSKAEQQAFWGNSNGYINSYVDLSPFSGEYILVRFRFGSDTEEEGATEEAIGWFVDDIEIMDMHNYHTEACAASLEGDVVCAFAPGRGTVVNAGDPTVVTDQTTPQQFEIFPNPGDEVINFAFTTNSSENVSISIFSIDGRKLKEYNGPGKQGQNHFSMDISDLPGGIYYCVAHLENNLISRKIIIK
jgi:extracellular elastinolytic metalloproteinase